MHDYHAAVVANAAGFFHPEPEKLKNKAANVMSTLN